MDALAWDESDGASERLLDDLFTFLDGQAPARDDATSLESRSDGSVASPTPAPTTKRRRATAKRGCPIKRTLDALRDEAEQLTQTLDRLRSDSLSSATELALTERYKRRRAERECEQLRDAVYAQAQFLRGLQSVFSMPPPSGLNLCRHLHNYTKLPRDRSVRWHEYAALSQETRLRRAMDILCRETQSLTCSENGGASWNDAPCIQTEVVDDATGFGVTSMSVFAVETKDLGAVLRGTCVAVRDIVQRCSSYKCTGHTRQIVDPEASASVNLLYRVMGVHHKSLGADSDELSIESRIVTLYKQTDENAVVLWDFVDDDELHPTMATTDITRQSIGACLIRREMCGDGVERSVCRVMNTRRYHFHARTQRSEASLARFREFSVATKRENELLFWNILVDAIAKEEAAYARVLSTQPTAVEA